MHCKSLWIKASAKCININVKANPILFLGPLSRKKTQPVIVLTFSFFFSHCVCVPSACALTMATVIISCFMLTAGLPMAAGHMEEDEAHTVTFSLDAHKQVVGPLTLSDIREGTVKAVNPK